jgi:hypothetical protein
LTRLCCTEPAQKQQEKNNPPHAHHLRTASNLYRRFDTVESDRKFATFY